MQRTTLRGSPTRRNSPSEVRSGNERLRLWPVNSSCLALSGQFEVGTYDSASTAWSRIYDGFSFVAFTLKENDHASSHVAHLGTLVNVLFEIPAVPAYPTAAIPSAPRVPGGTVAPLDLCGRQYGQRRRRLTP